YMMAVPMVIFYLNPVAAAGMNAFLGIVTVALIYYLGKQWFNKQAGLIAAYLYAISPVTITYSRSSWNPNPAPLFALISMFSLYKLHKTGNFLWLSLTGFFVAAALQMHYLAAILIPVVFILWLYEIVSRKLNQSKIKSLFCGTLFGILSFIFVMLPLVWFDLRHNYLNYRAITELLSEGSAVKSDILANIIKLPSLYSNNLIGRYIAGENLYLTIIVSLLVILALIYRFSYWPKIALGVWLLIGLLGLTFYQQDVYDHYLGFLNPAPFLLLGATLYLPKVQGNKKWLLNTGMMVLLVVLTVVNLEKTSIFKPANNQLYRTQEVAKFIIQQSQDRDFNFALLAQRNYDSAYQFYLDRYGHKPKIAPFDITDQLFVVCEDEVCDPVHSPKYEIAAFGWSKIEQIQQLYGVKLYKLVHNPSGKP
ncbi:glycosyltransferase family 39 protein, partial [Patescibacteria group bacterium]|nr:glycosyltransferase family 39 protein [Patescibacteria group bacterium]